MFLNFIITLEKYRQNEKKLSFKYNLINIYLTSTIQHALKIFISVQINKKES